MAQMPDLNVVCKNCGNEVSPYITECPYCGNRLRKRAPKIERDGTVSEPRKARKARKPSAAMNAFAAWIKDEIAALDWRKLRTKVMATL